MLDIRLNGIPFELFPDEENNFYMTKQLHDLSNLTTRNANFTKTFTVPYVGNNETLLRKYLAPLTRFNANPIDFSYVDVYLDGINIIYNARLFSATYIQNTKEVEITIIGGEQDFFNQLSDDSISLLFPETIDWTEANLLANANSETFWVFADTIWTDNPSWVAYDNRVGTGEARYTGVQDVKMSGFHLYFREVWNRIMANISGLTINVDFDTSLLDRLAMAVPTTSIFNALANPSGYLANVDKTILQTVDELLTGIPVTFDVITSNPDNVWSSINQEYTVPFTGSVGLTLNLFITVLPYQNTQLPNRLRITRNGATIFTQTFADDNAATLNYVVQYSAFFNLDAGDTIQAVVDTGQKKNAAPYKMSIGEIPNQGANFSMFQGESADQVPFSQVIPQIGQKDFIRSVLNILNLVPYSENQNIYFKFFKDILKSKPILLSNKIAINKTPVHKNTISGYAQVNEMNYLPNDKVERTDGNSFFNVDNKTIDAKTTKIELPYSASDNSLAPVNLSSISGRMCIPAYEYQYVSYGGTITVTNGQPSFNYTLANLSELKEGDILTWDDAGTYRRGRVIVITSDTQALFQNPTNSNSGTFNFQHFRYEAMETELHISLIQDNSDTLFLTDGTEQLGSASPSKMAIFGGEILWSNLLTDYYADLVAMMRKPWMNQTWLYLNTNDFLNINPLSPLYIQEYGTYFYLNKLEQYKPNQLTRAELIAFGVQVLPAPEVILEVDPVQVVLLGSVNMGDPSKTQIYTVRNTGSVSTTVAANITGSGYSILGSNVLTLAPNEAGQITVSFSPSLPAENKTGTIEFIPDGNNPKVVRTLQAEVIDVPASSSLITEIRTTEINQEVVLPLEDFGTYDFDVDWGDGSPIENITVWNNASHIYSNSGNYNIEVSGTCTRWKVDKGSFAPFPIRVISWGLVGMEFMNWAGCSNLSSIPTDTLASFSTVLGLNSFLRECSLITEIPEGLLRYATLCDNLALGFYRTNITSIPSDLFLTTDSINEMGLCFQETPITSIPADLFRGLPLLTNYNNVFASCTQLTSIPNTLLDNKPQLTQVFNMFNGCLGVQNYPNGLFNPAKQPNIVNFRNTFQFCYGFTNNCDELWNLYPTADGTLCFDRCDNMANIGVVPEEWGGLGLITAPTDIPDCVIWFDFSDFTTMNEVLGEIQQVNDKVSAGSMIASSASQRYIYSGNYLSKGSDPQISYSSNFPAPVICNNFTFIMLGQNAGTNGGNTVSTFRNLATPSHDTGFLFSDSWKITMAGGGPTLNTTTKTESMTSPAIFMVTGGVGEADLKLYVNGIMEASTPYSQGLTFATYSTFLLQNRDTQDFRPYQFIVYDRVLRADEIAEINDWLATKI